MQCNANTEVDETSPLLLHIYIPHKLQVHK